MLCPSSAECNSFAGVGVLAPARTWNRFPTACDPEVLLHVGFVRYVYAQPRLQYTFLRRDGGVLGGLPQLDVHEQRALALGKDNGQRSVSHGCSLLGSPPDYQQKGQCRPALAQLMLLLSVGILSLD